MKIFHGLQNIGGMAGVMAAAQRQLGAEALSYCLPVPRYEYPADRTVQATTRRGRMVEIARFFAREGRSFDCFHFYFGESLSGARLWDVPWLKRLGKRVFFYFCGCDIRDSKQVIATYEHSACQHCWPMLCSANRAEALRMARTYADGVFVSTPDLLEFVPGAIFLPQPVPLARFAELDAAQTTAATPCRPGIDRPVRIAHAPSNRQIKGTEVIVAAVMRLQQRGLPIELVMIEHMPHAQVLAVCAGCDLAIDQVRIGAYGQYAVEMMALGKPTICYLRPDLRAYYPADCPIISASPEQLEAVLADWIAHPAWWSTAGAAGRAYVARFHDIQTLAQRCLEAYCH
jgi:hypothetical protein